jgi:hypothetical protein
MPGENRLGLDDRGDFRWGLFAEPFANLSERLSLPIVQSDTARDLLPQKAIFCHKIFITQQQFLVYRARDVCQQCLPIHARVPSRSSSFLRWVSMRDAWMEDKPKSDYWLFVTSNQKASSSILTLRDRTPPQHQGTPHEPEAQERPSGMQCPF